MIHRRERRVSREKNNPTKNTKYVKKIKYFLCGLALATLQMWALREVKKWRITAWKCRIK
jgi:hypothetical protein